MPLPEFGELMLRPKGTEWLRSGEISGERLVVETHISFVNAFGSIEREMDLSGGDILAAVVAEQHWDSKDTTPLQTALLTNLVGARRARVIKSRHDSQLLIESLYSSEYYPAEIIADESDDEDYAEQLNARFHVDVVAVRTAINPGDDLHSEAL